MARLFLWLDYSYGSIILVYKEIILMARSWHILVQVKWLLYIAYVILKPT